MKYQPKVVKPNKVGTLERLATPKPRKPRFLFRWLPTGRLFDQEGKLAASSNFESPYDCSNGNLKLLINFVWKFMGTIRFGNDHVAAILGFGDLQWGNILITRVYFIEGLGHNLFSVGQFCDIDLEVAFRRNACFVRNLKGVDLLKGDYSSSMPRTQYSTAGQFGGVTLMARASSIKSWTKKIMETMNVLFDELSAMAFEQCSSKPGLNSMTSGHISSGLDLTYAPSTITTQQPSEGELDLLFEAMYDDYIGGQPSATARTILPAQEPQVLTSQDVDELNPNAMVDGNTFVNPIANSSISAAAASSS
nr:integrase, catalytic region, zinc finger, CCHC-type, peptidase aspartic, catalytic [Tanacetum cinerariifolium]